MPDCAGTSPDPYNGVCMDLPSLVDLVTASKVTPFSEVFFPPESHVRVHVAPDVARDAALTGLLTEVLATASNPTILEQHLVSVGEELGLGITSSGPASARDVVVARVASADGEY